MWRTPDYIAGNVTRCLTCQGDQGDPTTTQAIEQRLAAVWEQSGDSQCLACYGTGFTGGVKGNPLVLYVLIQDASETLQRGTTGEIEQLRPDVSLPPSPEFFQEDLLIRVRVWDTDGVTPLVEEERYLLGHVEKVYLRTGQHWGRDQQIIVGQTAPLRNLPANSVLYQVPNSQ